MPNLMLTTACNQQCPYCFARTADVHGARAGAESAAFDAVERFLDVLARSGIRECGLIGGEPTLHELFAEILRYALRRDFMVQVFSNGLIPGEALDRLAATPPDRVRVLVNVNERTAYSPAAWGTLTGSLGKLGSRAALGFNIWHVGFDASHLVDLAVTHGLHPSIRLSIAHPAVGEQAHASVEPADYPALAEPIVALAEHAARSGLRVGFDCGFRACMFSPDQLRRLHLAGSMARFKCETILDFSPRLECWNCFPLANVRRAQLGDFPGVIEAKDHFRSFLEETRREVLPHACLACDHFGFGICRGGCLAVRLREAGRTGSAG